MKIYNQLQKIKNHLKQNKKLWLEHEYNENGKSYKKEFFIKLLEQAQKSVTRSSL